MIKSVSNFGPALGFRSRHYQSLSVVFRSPSLEIVNPRQLVSDAKRRSIVSRFDPGAFEAIARTELFLELIRFHYACCAWAIPIVYRHERWHKLACQRRGSNKSLDIRPTDGLAGSLEGPHGRHIYAVRIFAGFAQYQESEHVSAIA